MKCPQCARWIQMGLAVLTSSLVSAANAATLEDYTEVSEIELSSTRLASSIQEMAAMSVEKVPRVPESGDSLETISKQLTTGSSLIADELSERAIPDSYNGLIAEPRTRQHLSQRSVSPTDKVNRTIPEEAIPRTLVLPSVSSPTATDTTLVSEEILVAQTMPDDTLEPEASETTDSNASDNLVQATGTATDLKIKPFFNINYNLAGGHDGFAGLEAFYPVIQTPGNSVGFLTGRLTLDVNGDAGGGLQAGYRALFSETAIWGVYSGFDIRETGDNTFGQLGFGAELLSNTWDARLNASFPVGDTQKFVSSSSQLLGNPRFAGTNLIVDQAITELSEAAITTVSLDGGVQIFDCCGSGALWGRGGLYYLGGQVEDDSVGVRASLDYRPREDLRFGLGAQHDEVFGTNVILSANFFFGPGASAQRPEEVGQLARLWSRAGEPLARTNTILVEEQVDNSLETLIAINPATGQDFIFRHVDPANGAAGAGGTFEAPRDTIANTVGIANAGEIIYVQAGNAGGSFTIPDGVQVLSVGPEQVVETQFGAIALPGSGSGNFPTISDTVTLGNDTVISGFDITGTTDSAIVGLDGLAGTVVIADNLITSTADNGIDIGDLTEDLEFTITRNQITNAADDGIDIDNIGSDAVVDLTISDNIITGNGDTGIDIDEIYGTASASLAIQNNDISSNDGSGIYIDEIYGDAVVDVMISDNSINNNDGRGIYFGDIHENAVVDIAINDNSVDGNNDNGIFFDDIYNDATVNINIAGNSIDNNTSNGIYFSEFNDNAVVDITISDNSVDDNGDSGIRFDDEFLDDATIDILITQNSISNNSDDGIYIDGIYDNSVVDIVISDNIINDNGDTGVDFENIADYAQATIVITGNSIDRNVDSGLYIGEIYGDAQANFTISQNSISDNGGNGIYFSDFYEDAVVDITISDNTIDNNDNDGVRFQSIEDNVEANITISSNSISNNDDNGVYFDGFYDDAIVNLTISDNTINDNGDYGVVIEEGIYDNTDVTISLTGNTISGNGNSAFYIEEIGDYAVVDIVISDNIIQNNDDAGVALGRINDYAEVDVTITGNTITGNNGHGIYLEEIEDYAVVDVNISDNTISDNADFGIYVEIYDYAAVTANVSGNTVEGNGSGGISFEIYDDAVVSLTLDSNTINDNLGPGVYIYLGEDAEICLALSDNVSNNPGNTDFVLNNDTGNAAQFEIVDLANVTTNNTGTFDPADPAGSGDFTSAIVCP